MLAVSGLAHTGLLALLALKHPRLPVAEAPPVFEVEVVPLIVPASRRELRAPSSPSRQERAGHAIAPRFQSPPDSAAEPAVEALPQAFGLDDGLRQALRRGAIGCANSERLGLDAEERDRCLERFGQGAQAQPHIPAGMAPSKRAAFDDKSAARERMRLYRQGIVPPGGEAHIHPQLGYVPSLTQDIMKAAR